MPASPNILGQGVGPAVPCRALRADAERQLAGLGLILILAVAPLGWRGLGEALLGYGGVAAAVLRGLPAHAPHRRFGLANRVTLARAAFATLLLAVLGEASWGGLRLETGLRWLLVGGGFAALLLDGLDGWLARRLGLVSAFGARFDLETDAVLILVLALLVVVAGQAGPWVLAGGVMRYLFVLASWAVPALAAPLPESRRRKAVCVAQSAALILALAPVLSPGRASIICLAALTALSYSFGRDIWWLSRRQGKAIG